MSAGRYRGLFWAPDGEPVPGILEIAESGALSVELQGRLLAGGSAWHMPDEAVRMEGEIADSPFPGPMVTLLGCLQTQRRSGIGGSLERWLAHRALIGNAAVDADMLFDRATLGILGLSAFLGQRPPLGDPASEVFRVSPPRTEVERFVVGDWKVVLGWGTSSSRQASSLQLEQAPFIEVELEEPCSVDDVLGKVVPVFEAILTIALRVHARSEQIMVGSSDKRAVYRVLGPRVEAPADSKREFHRSELLFHLAEMPGGSGLIERTRQMLAQHPEFAATFLGYERAPPRYVEDRVRASVLTLAHLARVFPGVIERSRQWLTFLESAPEQIQPFLPSAALVAVPEFVREMLTPRLCEALDVSSKEAFVGEIGPAFRWATLREGSQTGYDILRLNHQLRTLLHLALLKYLGFEPDEAERRMVESIQQRGLML
ncbi:MAG TPA: hypothetical protein VK539_09820 [Myxococcaceae bacterium]|nr:hypothetical protein [Myxococcaceae bacterium]